MREIEADHLGCLVDRSLPLGVVLLLYSLPLPLGRQVGGVGVRQEAHLFPVLADLLLGDGVGPEEAEDVLRPLSGMEFAALRSGSPHLSQDVPQHSHRGLQLRQRHSGGVDTLQHSQCYLQFLSISRDLSVYFYQNRTDMDGTVL